MTARKSPFVTLLPIALVAACTFLARGANAEEWRIATLAPDGSGWVKVLSRGAAEMKSATEGRLSLKYYTGGVQGDEKDVVRKVKMGGLDGGALTSVGLSLIDESIRVLELPMMFESAEELDYVRNKMWPTFKKRFAAKGFILGDPGDVGFLYLYSNNPFKALTDIKKAKIWMWAEDAIVRAMYKKLNVNGVPLGVPDVLPALTTGRINACYGSPLAAAAFQWHTKVKYVTSMPMAYGVGASIFKKEKWDKLSAADQKKIRKIMRFQGKKLRQTVRRMNARSAKTISRSGVKTVETPAALASAFQKKAKEVWQQLAGKLYSKADLENVLKYRAEFRAKNK